MTNLLDEGCHGIRALGVLWLAGVQPSAVKPHGLEPVGAEEAVGALVRGRVDDIDFVKRKLLGAN